MDESKEKGRKTGKKREDEGLTIHPSLKLNQSQGCYGRNVRASQSTSQILQDWFSRFTQIRFLRYPPKDYNLNLIENLLGILV